MVAPRLVAAGVATALLALGGHGCGSTENIILPDPATVEASLGTITGTVTAGGIPQSGAAIATNPATDETASDGVGAYTLTGLSPGRYTLATAKPGFQARFDPVVVSPGKVSRVDVDLLPQTGSASLAGQVTDGAFGLAGVFVETVPATQSVVTTSDGRFLVTGSPGQYRVTASRRGYSAATRVVTLREGRTETQDFALGARSDGRVLGQVTDPIGTPLVNARVDVLAQGQVVTAFTDAAGNYGFQNLVTGFYVLSATQPGFLPGAKGYEVRGGAASNGDLVLYPVATPAPVPGAITGTVADRLDAPVAGVTVTLDVAANPASAVTGTDGRFTFVDVPPGSVTVTATPGAPAPGDPVLAPGSVVITVGAAQTADGGLNLEET